jgi:hypothetical protein
LLTTIPTHTTEVSRHSNRQTDHRRMRFLGQLTDLVRELKCVIDDVLFPSFETQEEQCDSLNNTVNVFESLNL